VRLISKIIYFKQYTISESATTMVLPRALYRSNNGKFARGECRRSNPLLRCHPWVFAHNRGYDVHLVYIYTQLQQTVRSQEQHDEYIS